MWGIDLRNLFAKDKSKIPGEKKVSKLGFGGAFLPTFKDDKSSVDLKKTEQILGFAIRNGIKYFDTGWQYHMGKSEETLSQLLSVYPRNSYYLSDKLPIWNVNSIKDVDYYFNEQLKRCNTEYFDYYLIHSVNDSHFKKAKDFDVYNNLSNKKREGKILNLGFSFSGSPELLKEVLEEYNWDFVMLQLTYFDWIYGCSKDLYDVVREKKVPIVVMQPFRRGLLSKKSKMSELALKFICSLDGVEFVICGMREIKHLKNNLGALNKCSEFSSNDFNKLDIAVKNLFMEHLKICNGCQKCEQVCPKGIKIPGILLTLQQLFEIKDQYFYVDLYSSITKTKRAEACDACGKCLDVCPKKVNISELMGKISKINKSKYSDLIQ